VEEHRDLNEWVISEVEKLDWEKATAAAEMHGIPPPDYADAGAKVNIASQSFQQAVTCEDPDKALEFLEIGNRAMARVRPEEWEQPDRVQLHVWESEKVAVNELLVGDAAGAREFWTRFSREEALDLLQRVERHEHTRELVEAVRRSAAAAGIR
jgi:hypothetical protein